MARCIGGERASTGSCRLGVSAPAHTCPPAAALNIKGGGGSLVPDGLMSAARENEACHQELYLPGLAPPTERRNGSSRDWHGSATPYAEAPARLLDPPPREDEISARHCHRQQTNDEGGLASGLLESHSLRQRHRRGPSTPPSPTALTEAKRRSRAPHMCGRRSSEVREREGRCLRG